MLRRWYLAVVSIGLLVGMVCFPALALQVVDFTVDPQTPIVAQVVTFTQAVSGVEPGWITAYEWDFGDGATDNGESVQHAFMIEGVYEVTLTVRDIRGGTASIHKDIRVRVGQLPVAAFTPSPTTAVVGGWVRFDGSASSDPDGWIERYRWEFGDETPADTGEICYHQFMAAGTYTVTLTVTDNDGLSDTEVHTVQVASVNQPPVAGFTFLPSNPMVGDWVQFDGSGSSDPDGSIASYAWSFGDGTTLTGATPRHQFMTAGTYTVILTVTDNDGASDTEFHTIQVVAVNQDPTAAFSFSPTDPVVGDWVQFDGSGSSDPDGSIVSYAWSFGDGSAPGSGSTVYHRFGAPNDYTITLTVIDNDGASDTTPQTVNVASSTGPRAGFTFTPPNPTTQDPVHFFDQSTDPTGNIASWNWSFGDGVGSGEQNPVHTFATPGTYQVSLTITNSSGATAATSQRVVVLNAPPIADFTVSPAEPKVGEMVTFSAGGSSDPDGQIVLYEWDFDSDGIYDIIGGSASTVTHAFDVGGRHIVTLRVTDDAGAGTIKRQLVPVGIVRPTAVFTYAPDSPRIGEAVSFDASDSSDQDGTIIFYQWDFDDVVGNVDATGVSVVHTFTTPGGHSVTLTVTNNNGNTGTKTEWVNVGTTPPTAAFTFTPANPNAGQVVSFNANGSTDGDGTIILYQWDFDSDGNTDATGLAVTHAFPAPGVYPVRLTVTDNDMEFDVITKGVPVEMGGTGGANQPPVADFTYVPADPPSVNLNEVVTFKAEGCSDPDGTIASYEWDFNGDGLYDATGTTVTHIFHTGGGKVVTLRVLDNEGAPGFKTRVVSVEFVRPTADFTFSPDEPRVGDVVSFDGSVSSDEDGRIDFYEWDFNNDGNTDATGMLVTHVFTRGGGNPVTLKVTDNDGMTGLVTKAVSIRINTEPLADFTYSPENPTTADTIAFTSTSSDFDGTIIAWQWEFGDGETSDAESPSHKYATAKTYIVKLTVTDNDGATSSATKDVTVGIPRNVPPVADFSFTPALPQVNQAVQLNDLSTDSDGTVTGWDWDFGDGGTSTDKNPAHTYTSAGTYTVTLVVTDNEGASSAQATKQITIGQAGADIVTYSYPNPASTEARIIYSYPAGTTDIMLRVFDITGALVFSKELSTADTEYLWNLESNGGDPLPNGLYSYVITAKDASGKTIKSAIFKLLIVR